MTTATDVQRRLISLGYNIGGADGVIGPRTLAAILDALPEARGGDVSSDSGPIPADWLPSVKMERIIVHWTAGQNDASAFDREHYHLLIEGGGAIVRGIPSIALNSGGVKPGYAAHTLNCNSGSIGVSLCGMAGAVESPFHPGIAPITAAQWAALAPALAQLCRRYGIAITPQTVLTHAEVQTNLGIAQRSKWDIAALPFNPAFPRTAKAVGDRMRAEAKAAMAA